MWAMRGGGILCELLKGLLWFWYSLPIMVKVIWVEGIPCFWHSSRLYLGRNAWNECLWDEIG